MSYNKNFFVIVNYNSGNNIITCIDSIMRSKKIDRPIIIIVDNASRDNSLEECKIRFPKNIYIYNTHNIGFGAAANIGARYALERDAHTITFCNPDAILDPYCMKNILHTLKTTGAGIVSPIIYTDSGKKIWFDGGIIDFVHMRAIHKRYTAPNGLLDTHGYISGCIMTVDADVFQKIGLFDEQFFLYYEDADFSMRAQKNNILLAIAPNARALHKEVSEEDLDVKTYFLVFSGLLFFTKHMTGVQKLYFHVHHHLRRIKNHINCKQNKPLARSVYQAFIDYEQKK